MRVALFKGLGRKVKSLWALFKRAPQVWEEIKGFLDIKKLTEIPRKIKEWAKKGMQFLRKTLSKLFLNNPFAALYVIPKNKMPGVTDMLARVMDSHPKIKTVLGKVNTGIIKPIDKFLAKHPLLKAATRPLMAYAFIVVWLNVAEISWDLPGLIRGFTGGVSVGELLSSLPESGLGFLLAMLFPGMGTFALLPVTIMARITYLLIKKIIVWVKGKGFLVDWAKLGMPGMGQEMVPASL
jgi:hypothetical protein